MNTTTTDTLDPKWFDALTGYCDLYQEHGTRSNKKLLPPHKYLGDGLVQRFSDLGVADMFVVDYVVADAARGIDGYRAVETAVPGAMYDKNCDVVISLRQADGSLQPISVVNFKFFMSSYNKNGNNYFEQLMGECANLRLAGISYNSVYVIPQELPLFRTGQEFYGVETPGGTTANLLSKYNKLQAAQSPVAPNRMALNAVASKFYPANNNGRLVLSNQQETLIKSESSLYSSVDLLLDDVVAECVAKLPS